MHSPLGSRRAVIDELTAALTLAASGVGPRTLVLTAGPGAGKSHTLRHLASVLGVETSWATADELSWRQPFAVAATLLGVPMPAPLPEGFGDVLDAAADALCARGPRLLVIDDAHNADAGSLEVLGRLASAAPDLPLVVLVARRHLPSRELLTRLVARPTVREWHLPPMDAADLDVLVHRTLDAWPDEQLSGLLAHSGGNPMHALAILDDLRGQDRLVRNGDRTGVRSDTGAAPSDSLHAAIRQQLAMLDEGSRGLVQTLAVWGAPATLAELAAVDGTSPAALVGPAQTAIDAGVLTESSSGALVFAHDIYGDVAYETLAPTLRAVLHTEIARRHDALGNRQLVAHHLLAAGADDSTAGAAIARARQELAHAPAVEVDLLDTAAGRGDPRTLEVDLATALARSGQLARCAEVASQGLARATDPATIAQLHHILLFTLIAQGHSTPVLELTEATLALPVDDEARAALTDVRHYVGLLAGSVPVPTRPFTQRWQATASEMSTEALRRFLTGDGVGGLEAALEASRAEGQAQAAALSTSADVWPPFIEQYVHGPIAARALLDRATQLRTARGSTWMTAYLEFTRGGIELALGRLDDAAASFDTGLDRAAVADLGWTSMAEGARAMIDVYRGDFAAADARLDGFARSGALEQFGLPMTGQARALLLEAQRKLKPADRVARECWDRAAGLGLTGWLPALALDCARIAVRAGDDLFAATIAADLAALPAPVPVAAAGSVELARALVTGDPARIAAAAGGCARTAHELGDALAEACAWEEAACAAATSGDRDAAREHARQALLRTRRMGASAWSARITSRLRALGVRLDARLVRERPRTGWESLTRTEVTIAELVASGLNSAEIAEKLFISGRTVQTHVSHALTKLGLRTRVELAALTVQRRHAAATPARTAE